MHHESFIDRYQDDNENYFNKKAGQSIAMQFMKEIDENVMVKTKQNTSSFNNPPMKREQTREDKQIKPPTKTFDEILEDKLENADVRQSTRKPVPGQK